MILLFTVFRMTVTGFVSAVHVISLLLIIISLELLKIVKMYSQYHSKSFYLNRLFYREVGEMYLDGRKFFCQAVVLLRKDKDKLSCPCFSVPLDHLAGKSSLSYFGDFWISVLKAAYLGGLSALTVHELHSLYKSLIN